MPCLSKIWPDYKVIKVVGYMVVLRAISGVTFDFSKVKINEEFYISQVTHS